MPWVGNGPHKIESEPAVHRAGHDPERSAPHAGGALSAQGRRLLSLQRTAGNRAVRGVVQRLRQDSRDAALAPQGAGLVQRWKETKPEDGGTEEVEELLSGVDWDALVAEEDRHHLEASLNAVMEKADVPGDSRKEVWTAIAAGKRPSGVFEDLFLELNGEITLKQATTLRDGLASAMAATAHKLADEAASKAKEASAKKAQAAAAALAQQQKLVLEKQVQDQQQAVADIAAVKQLLAGNPILRNVKLKPQEDRNLVAGPATDAQAQAAVALWTDIPDQLQLTNFHNPGNRGFVSKWRPPDVDVNVVLKCYIFGNKEIIIHITPEEALRKRMVEYHNNDWKVTGKVRQYIPAQESEGWRK